MKKLWLASLIVLFSLSSCTNTGLRSAAQGVGHLVLSPVQIAAGVLEGLASLPYYVSTGLHELNDALALAQSGITLEDTYDSVYEKDIDRVRADGNTGHAFRRMKKATIYCCKINNTSFKYL